jgi:8-oxo-dGTP pyrophosphatase MutT (NUDIX family)
LTAVSFLERVEACNRLDLKTYRPFLVDGRQAGWIGEMQARILGRHPKVFTVTNRHITFALNLDTPVLRTKALAGIANELAATGHFGKPRGEIYAAKTSWSAPALFNLDRALVAGFGVRAYGVHVNGFVRRADGLHLWIGTRAADREVEPGKLDNMVAGGQPADLSLLDNLIKECREEADIKPELAKTAKLVGALSYAFGSPNGIKADTLFCYDLELPADVIPRNTDGEIAGFELMPLADVLRLVHETTRFKFNVNLVILDFAIRHGVLDPDKEPDFEAIVNGLHKTP